MLQEFKKFISKGNVIDLAVGVVMGGAVTTMVNELVQKIITPIIGIVLGGIDFKGLSITVGSAVIEYGYFIQAIINFLLIGFVLFLIVKAMNTLQEKRKKQEEENKKAKRAQVPVSEIYLKEIRDYLIKQQNTQAKEGKQI